MVHKVYPLGYEIMLFEEHVAVSYENQGSFYDHLIGFASDIQSSFHERQDYDVLNGMLDRINFRIDEGEFVLNGYAELNHDKKLNININLGTYLSLADLFHVACARDDFFWDYGFYGRGKFSIREGDPGKRFYDYGYLREVDKNRYIGDFLLDFPSTHERLYLAKLLTVFASRFIYAHELGHFLRGHIHYLHEKKAGKKAGLTELNLAGTGDSIYNFTERIILEHEADQSAVSNCIDVFESIFIIKEIPNERLRNHMDWARIFMVAIGATCLIFEKARQQEDIADPDYPSPACRLLNALVRFAQEYQFNGGDFAKIFKQAYKDVDGLEHCMDNYTLDKNFIELDIIINNALADLAAIADILKIGHDINFNDLQKDVFNENLWNFSDDDHENINTLSPYGKELRRLYKYDSEIMLDKLQPYIREFFPGYPTKRKYAKECYDDEQSNKMIREQQEKKIKLRGY